MEKPVEDRWTMLSSFAVAGLWSAVLLYCLLGQRTKGASISKPTRWGTAVNEPGKLSARAVSYQRGTDDGPQFCAHEFYDV